MRPCQGRSCLHGRRPPFPAGGRWPMAPCSRPVLYQLTHCRVSHSNRATDFHGPKNPMTPVLNRPITLSARALSKLSPTLPAEMSIPASANIRYSGLTGTGCRGPGDGSPAALSRTLLADRPVQGVRPEARHHGCRGAVAVNSRLTLSSGQDRAGSGIVVLFLPLLPRVTPCHPCSPIRRSTVQRAISLPSRRS